MLALNQPTVSGEIRATKATLVAASHAIEQAAVAAGEDAPMAVFALFQQRPYFLPEARTYRRLAERATVVVAFVDDGQDHGGPPAWVPLLQSEALAQEWTIVVLTPRFGAALVAHDRQEVHGSSPTLEGGRLFDAALRFRRDDALHHTLRLTSALQDRIPSQTLHELHQVIERTRQVPPSPGEVRYDAGMGQLVAYLERTRQRRASATPDVHDVDYLRRWSNETGTTASGVLPLAMVGIRLGTPDSIDERLGRRTAGDAMVDVLRMLTGLLGPADRAIRSQDGDIVLVLPAVPKSDAIRLATQCIAEATAILDRHHALGFMGVVAAVAVSSRRPLPLNDLRDALTWARANGTPLVTVPND